MKLEVIDAQGRPTKYGTKRLEELRRFIGLVLSGYHNDSTNAECRIDLSGHDRCYVCNTVETVLRAHVNGEG